MASILFQQLGCDAVDRLEQGLERGVFDTTHALPEGLHSRLRSISDRYSLQR